ncbi:MAG: Spo0E family sporulation regulatory protein-aspartic acid phosphatase [Clostridia bacterium]|nr:Spo0E family sporulation regulatory protein-aspartic acid phosphatase [Clostridia bacterium]
MVIDEIDVLRRKLEKQVVEKCSYKQIYKTSTQIDKLLIDYYEEQKLIKDT